ncbi:NADH pyrophosphatase [Bifidobacterium pseudolongum subsp. globosum]|uniref:NAD(+) diphosphatase n=1 Tax=Bifidobacterium pseudolongum TaxID=1694 RepID=UPI000C70C7C8|nr:NAD(+) diphosphatase [Bifidobacterium pseudolongum]NLW58106.1 NAD(+) diphosphatase [Bifidobacterium pseudolongum subsp. globosum]PKU95529.1 NADH pyrophosphatase [Bifidobacterium pseudolongum subsp. globosum]RYQ16730.1 NADH pyrophosphatase [Bifidobacterium pseudolongum subsp. globosum]RYQ33278.1 NADH pyrophosphatase [Bifidobacterium pseudolongum subsp. globosum]RYQ44059.1 NADH pyrophosphatase [Bifidobacterium pseudolongum subsp. globosum]
MFAPLALTQALPYLPLAQGSIDYQVERRADPGLIDRTLREAGARVVLTRNGLLAVPLGQRNAAAQPHARMRLATLPGAYVADALASHPHVVAMYLGEVAGAHPERIVALDISAVDAVPPAARAVDAAFDERGDTAGGPAVLESAVQRFDWVDLRAFVPRASGRDIGVATTMLSLANWFAYQTHCPACGAPTRPAMSGWAQRCTNGDDGHRLLFPRVEPAVIMTVVDSQDRLLLQHNRAWADPTLYSVSAGFVEAGENLEHACRRETMEETGIEVGEVKYLGSQPWPFKISLMMAFKGQALSTQIHVDGEEVADARWVTRDEFTDLLVTGRISAPGKATIARYMIEEWYGRSLD